MITTLRKNLRQTGFYGWLGTKFSSLKGRIYDHRHGVYTTPEILLKDLSIEGPNGALGGNYSGTEPWYFNEILDDLRIDFERFTFIDLGSGMGRALFLASSKPFKKIIGVEFARELHEIAEQNIGRFSSREQRCFAIESICADASMFEFPPGPLVCYFFNPFEREIFEKVIGNLQTAVTKEPREVYVIYCNPVSDELFVEHPMFVVAGRGPWHALHRTVAAVSSKVAVYISSLGWLEYAVH